MGSIGAPEILVILVLALLVLGPERLPQAARTAGRWVGEIRRYTASLQAEVQGVVDEVMQPVVSTATAASDVVATTASSAADAEVGSPATSTTADGAEEEQAVIDQPGEPVEPFDPNLN